MQFLATKSSFTSKKSLASYWDRPCNRTCARQPQSPRTNFGNQASSVAHQGRPRIPFSKHEELYAKIDAITVGDHPWHKISIRSYKPLPDGSVSSWMTTEFEVWYRDPLQLVHDLISNPDFANEFDYTPYQEYSSDEAHCFRDLFSDNWAWKQAVWFVYIHTYYLNLQLYLQDVISEDPQTHGSFFCPIIIGSDKQRFQLVLVTFRSVIYIIALDEHIEMVWFIWDFCLLQKVSFTLIVRP